MSGHTDSPPPVSEQLKQCMEDRRDLDDLLEVVANKLRMVRQVCDGEGSYADYTDSAKLYSIASIVGAESGWDGEE